MEFKQALKGVIISLNWVKEARLRERIWALWEFKKVQNLGLHQPQWGPTQVFESTRFIKGIKGSSRPTKWRTLHVAHKVMWADYYWTTLFKDAHAYVHKCSIFQRCVGCDRKLVTQLHPIVVEEPFKQWGLDVIGEIFPHSSKQY